MNDLFCAPVKRRKRVDFIVPPSADRATCSSCGAPIAWVTTWRDGAGRPKRMPLDLLAVPPMDNQSIQGRGAK